MGYMAFYVALFYFLIAEIAMKGEDHHFDFPAAYSQRNRRIPTYGEPVRPPASERLAKFFLFTPGETRSQTLDPQDKQSLIHFDPALSTVMIIHGFLDGFAIASWMHEMKDELLIYGNYNVIAVDWSAGNSIPYARAAANTEKVGQEISDLLQILLNEYGAKPETFHLIGHSLGSHIAGFVGENIKGIGRITGLDPAGPRFENEDPRRRLDPSDAIFVDVIHTDAGGIGMREATGHQDFYPNGGELQPGCTMSNTLRALIEEGVIEGARNLICSHMRATYLFTASINNRYCEMTGVPCKSWEQYDNGKCGVCGASGEECTAMGFHADARRTLRNSLQTYYLLTTSKEPYCVHEYRITFEIESTDNFAEPVGLDLIDVAVIDHWTLELSVRGSQGTSVFQINGERFDSNLQHVSCMVPSKIYLGSIDTTVAEWKLSRSSPRVLFTVPGRMTVPLIKKIEITPVKNSPWMDLPENYVLCSRETSTRLNEKFTFGSRHC